MSDCRAFRVALVLLAAALPMLGAAGLPGRAAASDGRLLTGLRLIGGNVVHADNSFRITWDQNPPPALPGGGVRYIVRGPAGEPLPGFPVQLAEYPLDSVTVSVWPVPGVYIFEAWDWAGPLAPGERGPSAFLWLSFDDARPPAVSVSAPSWVAAGAPVPIHVSHPAAPLPISGIAGYAVSVDSSAGGSPCARDDRCAPGELDLAGGIDDDSLSLPSPPEGVNYVHAVAVTRSGMSSTATATVPIGVDGSPPRVRLEGMPAGWASGPVRLTARAGDQLSGMAAAGPGGAATAIEVDGSPPLLAPGATASTTVAGEGVHRVAYWGRDAVGNAGDGSLAFSRPATAAVRIDETPPTVRFAAHDPGDPERIEAGVEDALSGPAAEGGRIELRPAGGSGRFRPLPTEARDGKLLARWNSDDFPHGDYEFRAVGFDAAGNSATSRRTADGDALVLHDPVKREARLAFGFGADRLVYQRCSRSHGSRRCHRKVIRSFAKRPRSRVVPCCHGAVVGGRLLDAEGAPLAGQSVDVIESFVAGARTAIRHTIVTTNPGGTFRALLSPGPSREVSARFGGTRLLTRAAGRVLRLRVRAAVRMHVSTPRARVGGAPVVFKGRVLHPEAQIPPTGLPVELEFRLPGMAWAEFRTLRSDAAGRFRYPYRFSDDDSAGVRFLFRAFVPATGDWAFAPATSRPRAVTG